MSDDYAERMEFAALVYTTLVAHPDWLQDAIGAISRGQATALEIARGRAGLARSALSSALALVSPQRMSADLRDTICAFVIRDGLMGMGREDDETMKSLRAKLRGLCEQDREFIRKTAAALDGK
jgi:hypothetical protein